ncbi:MAG: leucine-rich repeat domain-containing protein [Clostridia bacterium]|nr:leucine-rich repeat domain-containing protein [Clostridia bacterium]
MMMELADGYVNEGDIVIFTPEVSEQSLSTYFSASEAWYALDSDLSMYGEFSSDYKGNLAGSYFGYVADKLSLYKSGSPAQASGIYARSSFDDHCDLKNYDRPYNVMQDEVDENSPIYLETTLFSDDFIEYVNDFYSTVKGRGADMYFSFAPMNKQAVSGDTSAFYGFVCDSFDFTVISNIEDYIMDKEWFYDSNYHLNSSGMTVRTVNLVNDIKNQLGNTTKTDISLPEKPVKPDISIEGEGDNTYAGYFTYQLDGNYYVITGLTEEGKTLKEVVIPYQVNGVYVKSFTADVFAGNTAIQCVTVQENISTIADDSFNGCTSLKKIILTHGQPSDISVGYGLLNGTDADIYVPQDSVSAFKNNYFWGHYADKIYGK